MNTLLFISLRWLDVLDIVLVALFISYFYSLVRGTVAMKILIGLVVILIFWKITLALQMELVADIIGTFIGVGSLAFIIIFQPELRKFLIKIGSNNIVFDKNARGWFTLKKEDSHLTPAIKMIVSAVAEMASTKTGAIIVIDSDSDLDSIIGTGTTIDAEITGELLTTIFNKTSPLHDGATIISKNRIVASGCILPNTDRDDLPKTFGLRHRAVIGLSEGSDAFIILVSEETGKIMTAHQNRYTNSMTLQNLTDKLVAL